MRQNIEFPSKGLLCRGWLYVPDSLAEGQTAPGIVMAHGFACVKEMGLAGFAERFAKAGFVTLVFDYRFWGESEGEPRNQIFALESLIHLMAPTALLLIPAENDNLIPIEAVKEAYEKAREPKALSVLPITHFVLYKDPWLSKAADLATDWFRKHL